MTSAKEIAATMMSENQPVVVDTPQWTPFPVDLLPEPLRQFVDETANAIGCDRAMIALPMLGVLASAIGTTRFIVLKRRSWREYPILWAVVIAHSGDKKSPAMEAAVDPLQRIQTARFKEYEMAVADYEAAMLRYDADLRAWKAQRKEPRGDPPVKPSAPVLVRHVLSETTVEAVAPIHQENPRGLLVARDELSGWFGSFNQYKPKGGSDVANWIEMFRGGTVTIDRKTGCRVIRVPRAGVDVVGTIQHGILARTLTPQFFAAGLPARILMAAPPRRRKRWTDADVCEKTAEAYGRIIERLIELSFVQREDGEAVPVGVPMTPDAKKMYVDFYNEFAGQQEEEDDEDIVAAWSKIEGYAPRFALIFQLVGWASESCSPNEVDAGSMARGIGLARWFARETQRVYATLKETDEEREDRKLLDLIRRVGGSITVRRLMQKSRRYRNSAELAEAALQGLVKTGRGVWVHDDLDGHAGRPTSLFRLHDDGGNGNTMAKNQ